MTKWEIGQDLIAINDFIGEKMSDFHESGHEDLSIKLGFIQALTGDLFNDNNDHAFGIFDSNSLGKVIIEGKQ